LAQFFNRCVANAGMILWDTCMCLDERISACTSRFVPWAMLAAVNFKRGVGHKECYQIAGNYRTGRRKI